MSKSTLDQIQKELERINPLIEEHMTTIRSLKAQLSAAKAAGDKDGAAKIALELDKSEAAKNELKNDRYALWATEKELREQQQ